jgi:tetratricopeptide (TPR) repeat protein
LTQANESFLKSDFQKALEKFAVVLQNYPNSKEAYNGVILSEMALSGEGGAEAIYEYYEILKEEDKESADEIIGEILQNMDGSLDKIGQLLSEPFKDKLEYEDGILYEDFKNLVADGENFKEIFENVMFSTKVIITNKEDFLDFLENLIEHNFAQMALSYLENALSLYPSDKLLIKLFEKISQGKELENTTSKSRV